MTSSISSRVARDAGEMRGRRQRGLGQDALDGRVGALARRAAGAIGHRDEIRPQRREPLDRLPQRLLHLLGLRRKELERDADRARRRRLAQRLGAWRVHSRNLACDGRRSRGAGRARATARRRSCRPMPAPAAATVGAAPTSSPAAVIHCVTVSGAEAEAPMRVLLAQEFEIVRREIDHQQPSAGRSTRAASRDRARADRRGSAAPGG